MDLSKYNHKITEKVKFHEVDMLGVCNNAVYFNYFEDARIDYLQNLSQKYELEEFLKNDSFVIMAHNEIDYINSLHLNDEVTVYTRIDKVSKSSFSFRHYILRDSEKKAIAEGGGVLVHIDKNSRKSLPLPEEFHRAIMDFEGV